MMYRAKHARRIDWRQVMMIAAAWAGVVLMGIAWVEGLI